MEPLPSNSPHFIGVMVAAASLLLLFWLGSRPGLRARLGDRGPLFLGLGSVALVAIGLLGNGNSGVSGAGTIWSGGELHSGLAFSQTHVNHGLAVGLSDEFIAYDGQLVGETPSFAGADFDSRLELTWQQYTGGSSPALVPSGSELVFRYSDVQNVLFETFGIGTDMIDDRWIFFLRLNYEHLDELVALQYFEHASTPEEQVAALEMVRFAVPHAAEWSLRALSTVDTASLSAEVQAELDTTRAYLQVYIDDPTLRSLPADLNVELPPLPEKR
jgi:hypothetical protein